ncbi:SDR family oxidoreductase [Streptomyces sp. NPDC052040]|uniref:SDR family oxidoreductase n=1 Tax=unclassified Streptomyces TaxID=2593676 RepID=UPI0037D53334
MTDRHISPHPPPGPPHRPAGTGTPPSGAAPAQDKDVPRRRTALVTGGSRGIGRACALALADAGHDVVVHCHTRRDAAESVAEEIRAKARRALVVQADVGSEPETRAMFRTVRQEWGHLDVAVVNGGITDDGYVAAMSLDKWERVIRTNLTGTFLVSREAVKLMRRTGGSIVLMSSTSGIRGRPGQCNYSASKGGMIAFGKSLAHEVAAWNIRVNIVAPGFTDTDMWRGLPADVRARMADVIPLGRPGTAHEVAAAVTYAASDGAGYLTGQVIVLDGGMTV